MFKPINISIKISIKLQIFIPLIQQVPILEIVEMLLYTAGAILSIFLVGLSVFSYRKSGLKKLQYAAIAFSLFCIFLIYEGFEHFYSLDNAFTDIVIPLSGSAIILFFFLAVIKKS
jgi:hypothetical protein